MKGCVLAGQVIFQDGTVPEPRWPEDREPGRRQSAAANEEE